MTGTTSESRPISRLDKKYSSDEHDYTHQKHKVLIVEDNKMLVKLYTAFLRDAYFVDVAYNGNDAITKIMKTPPHLVILDIMMPDLNGFSVAQKMYDAHIRIPIIVVTAKHLNAGELELLESLGIRSCFQKDDLNQDRLMAEIEKYLT